MNQCSHLARAADASQHRDELRSDAVQCESGGCKHLVSHPVSAHGFACRIDSVSASVCGVSCMVVSSPPLLCPPLLQYAEVLPALLDFADHRKWLFVHDQARSSVAGWFTGAVWQQWLHFVG